MSFYVELGTRIREIRDSHGYSCGDIAELTGLSTKFLYDVELGKKGISAENLSKVSEALKVSNDYLICGNVNRDSNDKFLKLLGSLCEKEKNIIFKLLEVMNNDE